MFSATNANEINALTLVESEKIHKALKIIQYNIRIDFVKKVEYTVECRL